MTPAGCKSVVNNEPNQTGPCARQPSTMHAARASLKVARFRAREGSHECPYRRRGYGVTCSETSAVGRRLEVLLARVTCPVPRFVPLPGLQ
jgi:hypothetical protein